MLKKLFAISVLGTTILPIPAYAAVNIQDAAGEILDNLANAESVDFAADIHFETSNDSLAQPRTIHVDIDGATDAARSSGSFDVHFWASGADGEFHEDRGSVVITPDNIYFAGSEDEWYFLQNGDADEHDVEEEIAAGTDEITAFMQEMLEHDVLTYRSEGDDVLNRTRTVRYAYEVDNDRLIDYLVESDIVPAEDANEVRDTFANNVTIGGKVWVDTSRMLPVMFTLNVNTTQSETSYTTLQFSILFKSINEDVEIEVPDNATSFEEYQSEETEDVIASIEATFSDMDTDGDGLTNKEEDAIWNSNPLSDDSDGDGYPDRTEVINGYNPNGDGKLDSDNDGLTDYNEKTIHWSDPYDSDTDNDGYGDGLEIANGYDPNGPGRW